VPGKNVRELAGHPLIAYSISAAFESGAFAAVVVSTDSEEIAGVARAYGAEVPSLRPPAMATSTSPDIEWVRHTLSELAASGRRFEVFSILRPTSPFRSGATLRRAVEELVGLGGEADSIRAVRLCREHPGKMWVLDGDLMRPLLPQPEGAPHHSRQYKSLPEVYVQDSSIEVAWTRTVTDHDSIAGERVAPFFAPGREGFSIDYPDDWREAEALIATGQATLPTVVRVSE
jgi:CMP-N,N'-diacetyllegionaminic acid synthase